MKKAFILVPGLLVLLANARGQSGLPEAETVLDSLFTEMIAATDIEKKQSLNDTLFIRFEQYLKLPGAFDYPFDSLEIVGIVDSPDSRCRIINWHLMIDPENHRYSGFLLYREKTSKTPEIYPLRSRSFDLATFENSRIERDGWYGALYYTIIPTGKKKGGVYTVLGFSFNNRFSNRKVIDVIEFTNGDVVFGKALFETPTGLRNRILFEYSSQVTMLLNWDEREQMIVYDHLVPIRPELKGNFQFYGPDLSHDAFAFEKDKWVLRENVIMRNR